MKNQIFLALVFSVNIYKRDEDTSISDTKPSALFWEQQGVDALKQSRNSDFDYSKYMVDNSPNTSLLLQDYPQVATFLFFCILGMIISLIGSILVCVCCVCKAPHKSDNPHRNKRLATLIFSFLTAVFGIFLFAMTISSLNDLSTGVTNGFTSTSGLLSSAESMILRARNSIQIGFKQFDIDFEPSVNKTQLEIKGLVDDMDAALTNDGLEMDAYLNATRISVDGGKSQFNETQFNAAFVINNLTSMTAEFNSLMLNLTKLDERQIYNGGLEEYEIKIKRFQAFLSVQFQSSVDTQSANDLVNASNPFDVAIPSIFIGESIHSKMASLHNKTDEAFITIKQSLATALEAIKLQLNSTDLSTLDASALKEPSKLINDQEQVVNQYVSGQSSGIYAYIAILILLLIITSLTMAFKMRKIAFSSLCVFMLLLIVSFVLSFVFYVLAFVIGEACGALYSSNTSFQKYTSAGFAAQELCLKKESLLTVITNKTVAAILPEGFNVDMLNVSKIVKDQIQSQSINLDSLDASLNQSAFDQEEFNKLFDDLDTVQYNKSSNINGDLEGPIGQLNVANGTLEVAKNVTVGDFDHFVGLDTNHVADYKFKVGQNQNQIKNVKDRSGMVYLSKNATIKSVDGIKMALGYAKQNASMAHDKLPILQQHLNENIALTTSGSKRAFNALLESIGELVVEQIMLTMSGATCEDVAQSMKDLQSSVCSIALYGLNGLWLSLIWLGYTMIVLSGCVIMIYRYFGEDGKDY